MARRKVSTTIYITPEQNADLKALHERTKVPIAEYIRQGIDMLLAKHRHLIPGHPFAISDEDLDALEREAARRPGSILGKYNTPPDGEESDE